MKKLLPYFVLGVMLTIVACTKYEDDPFISLRQPEKRLIGNWHIIAFEVDGVDSLNELFSRTNYASCDFIWAYDKQNSTYKWHGCVEAWYNVGSFTHTKEHEFISGYDFWIRPRYENLAPDYLIFKVLKLYRKDFWIQSNQYGKTYLIKFKKQ